MCNNVLHQGTPAEVYKYTLLTSFQDNLYAASNDTRAVAK